MHSESPAPRPSTTAASDTATAGPAARPAASPAPGPAALGRRLSVVPDQPELSAADDGCNSSSPRPDVRGEASRAAKHAAAKAGADLRGEVLLALAQLRLATPRQLKELLLPHQQGTDHVRRALRNLLAESPALVGRTHRAQHSYWYCTPAGLTEAAASGELPPRSGRATGHKAAAKTGLREHGLALVDTVLAFQRDGTAEWTDWQVELAHPTPAGTLVPDGLVLLADGSHAFVEIDRTMSYAKLLAKLERYDAYRNAPPTGRGNAARTSRSHWQETYGGPHLERAFPPVLFVFASAPRRAAPATREAAFHERASRLSPTSVGYRMTVATTTMALLTEHGAAGPVWRSAGRHTGEDRCGAGRLPTAR
ncbi:replication-relaxation family protein [Streptomyces niveiscabiei]|nr:replication-relaxation family protein [Streptomyces niveiscabiei]